MTKCVICGKKLRQFKTTPDWKDRDRHLNCRITRKKKEDRRFRHFVEQYKMMCIDKDWDYDFETNKQINL